MLPLFYSELKCACIVSLKWTFSGIWWCVKLPQGSKQNRKCFVHQVMLGTGCLHLSIHLEQCISKWLSPFQKVRLISKYLDQNITCHLLKQIRCHIECTSQTKPQQHGINPCLFQDLIHSIVEGLPGINCVHSKFILYIIRHIDFLIAVLSNT